LMDKRVFLFLLAVIYLWGVEAMNLASINNDLTASEASRYDLVFIYGVKGNRPDPVNKLDTMKGTFTKDMVMDPPITFGLTLTGEQMARIMERVEEIGFLSYSSLYAPPMGPVVGSVTPYSTYHLKLYRDGVMVKQVRMDTDRVSDDPRTENLVSLFTLIMDIIESTEAWKESPKPRGGYC
jgi:hypothetical protein